MSTEAAGVASVFDFELPPRPYPGLRPFTSEEWPIFFGRERMIDEVVGRLIGQRMLVIHGDSGCGKSSLIRAGVLPRLEQQCARAGGGWRTCSTAPGEAPLENLAEAIAELTGAGADAERRHELRRIVNSGAHGAAVLSRYITSQRDDHVCILIDQFEELFAHARHHGRQQATILIGLLIGLHQLADARLRVVLTMRSEFLGACAQYDGFAQAVNATQYLLPRMERADLRRAIQEPASLYDGEIAAELADRLITEAGGSQDQLPLIQHALMQLHDRRPEKAGEPWRLDLSRYPPGGLHGLLSDHADEVMRQLAPHEVTAPIIEKMFRALTEMNADQQAIRRPQTLAELIRVTGGDEPTLRRIIDAFRAEGASLLRPYGDAPMEVGDLIDISHEALIRCWRRIADDKRGWLRAEFDDGITWSALLVQSESFEKDARNVLSAATTEERREWLATRNKAWAERYGGRWDQVQRLITASVLACEEEARSESRARWLKVWRWGFVIASGLLLVAVLAVFKAVRATNQATVAMRRTQEEAERAKTARAAAEAAEQFERDALATATLDRRKLASEKAATDQLLAGVQKELAAIKTAAAKAPTRSELRQTVDNANNVIQQQVSTYNQTSKYATSRDNPRIYVHIAQESQRGAANELARRLTAPTRSLVLVTVPGVELVPDPPLESSLRCFDAAECKLYGGMLVDYVNRRLQSPQVQLKDFSAKYRGKDLGPMHFELYFARGDLILKGTAPVSKAAAD